jgi:hypothetical protein
MNNVPSGWGPVRSREDITEPWVLGINVNGNFIYGGGLKPESIRSVLREQRKQKQ